MQGSHSSSFEKFSGKRNKRNEDGEYAEKRVQGNKYRNDRKKKREQYA